MEFKRLNLAVLSKPFAVETLKDVRKFLNSNLFKSISTAVGRKLPPLLEVLKKYKPKVGGRVVKPAKDPKIEKLAQMQWACGKNQFKQASPEDSADMGAMYLADGVEHLLIACLIRDGDFQAAEDLRYGMDTASSEEMPDAVYRFLGKAAGRADF